MQRTLCQYDSNNFVEHLNEVFGKGTTSLLMEKYQIGTSKRWLGANVFWYLDEHGDPIDARVSCFDRQNGRCTVLPEWLSAMMGGQIQTRVLFYGSHLLSEDISQPVGLVDDERTAIVCSHFLPQYIWLAASTQDINVWEVSDLRVLSDRKVVIFPSLNSYCQWLHIAELLDKRGILCVVSDYLEKNASEQSRNEGLSIADFLLKKVQYEKETSHLRNLSPAEQLARMKAENPAIQYLIDTFDLELVPWANQPK